MQFRTLEAVNAMLQARSLPTATLFVCLVSGYYAATLVGSVALGSLVESRTGSSWAFFNYSVGLGRTLPGWCALWVWTKCFVRRPDKGVLMLARCGLILGSLVYAFKCLWLVGALISMDIDSAPTAVFLLLETVFAMFLVTVAVIVARFRRVSKLTWVWCDLVMLAIGVVLVVVAALRGLDVLDKGSVAVGVVVSAVVLGHKLARWAFTYVENRQDVVAAQLVSAADGATRRRLRDQDVGQT